MPILNAENFFRKGLSALAGGDPDGAAMLFQAAIAAEKERGVGRPQMRYLSYYGLSLSQSGRPSTASIRACEEAVRLESYNADLYLNLAKVYARAGRTTKALETLNRGLSMDLRHKGLRRELRRLDRRSAPTFRSLGRNHPINRFLGRVRTAMGGSKVPQKRTV